MNQAFRQWLYIALAILQLVSPLLHAHASVSESAAGLHLPGLEKFNVMDDEKLSASLTTQTGDVLIAVDFGLHGTSTAGGGFDLPAILAAAFIFFAYSVVFCRKLKPTPPVKYQQKIFLSPQSPRAPPILL